MTENTENQPTIFEHFKNIFSLLFKKQYKDSFNELIAFIKAVCVKLKALYDEHLKGQYVEFNGKRIPRTVIAILCVVLLYLISPMSCLFNGEPQPQKNAPTAEVVNYDQNGVKISMEQCGKKVICGDFKFGDNEDIEKLRIVLTLFSKNGDELDRIQFNLDEENIGAPLSAGSKFEDIEFPVDKSFGYFRISDVQINPKEDDDEYEYEED